MDKELLAIIVVWAVDMALILLWAVMLRRRAFQHARWIAHLAILNNPEQGSRPTLIPSAGVRRIWQRQDSRAERLANGD